MDLRISRVLSEALAEIRDNGRTLLAALSLPALVLALLSVWQFQEPPGSGRSIALFLPQLFLYALFAVTCHRVILLGRDRLPNPLGVYASKEVWQYAGAMLVFTVLGMLAGLLLAFFLWPILTMFGPESGRAVGLGMMVVLGLLGVSAMSRIVLFFPALAIGDGRNLGDILELSKPIWVRLAVLILASTIVTSLVSWPLNRMMEVSASSFVAVIPVFLGTLIGAYAVAVISCAYRARVESSVSGQGDAPEA